MSPPPSTQLFFWLCSLAHRGRQLLQGGEVGNQGTDNLAIASILKELQAFPSLRGRLDMQQDSAPQEAVQTDGQGTAAFHPLPISVLLPKARVGLVDVTLSSASSVFHIMHVGLRWPRRTAEPVLQEGRACGVILHLLLCWQCSCLQLASGLSTFTEEQQVQSSSYCHCHCYV